MGGPGPGRREEEEEEEEVVYVFNLNELKVVISGACVKNLLHNHIIILKKKIQFPAKQKTA